MKKLLLCLALPLVATSCRYLYEPDAGIPAYIYVPGVVVNTVPTVEGTNSHNIQDVWVYIDNEPQGVYTLPAFIPVLEEGTISLRFNGGILLNGISSTRAAYPHYAGFDTLLNLVRGETDTIVPVLHYNTDITFLWMEDFESQGFTLRRNVQSDTTLTRVNRTQDSSLVFEGQNGLAVWTDSERPYFMCETNSAFPLIRDGSNYFLELNYKNNIPMVVGLIVYAPGGSSYEQPIIQLNTTDTWKKQYINFSPYISGSSGYTYRVIIAANYNRTDGQAGTVLLDNLKLIH